LFTASQACGPPASVVLTDRLSYRWRNAGLWQTINHSLVMRALEAAGREASPTAGVLENGGNSFGSNRHWQPVVSRLLWVQAV